MSSGLGEWVWTGNERRWSRGPLLYSTGTSVLTSGTAYFAYMGFVTEALTPQYVRFRVTSGGSGAQTAEVGLYSSPNAPQRASQVMTKLVATGTLDDLTTSGVRKNTSAFATEVAAGTHLWAGIRTALATTQPRLMTYLWDGGLGLIQTEAGASALTSVATNTPALVTDSDTNVCPVLSVELD